MQPYTFVGKKEMTWWPWQRQFDAAKGCLDSPPCIPQLSPLLYYVVNGLSPSSLWMTFPDTHLGVFECSTYISEQKLSRMLSWKSCWLRRENQTLALQAPFFLNAHCPWWRGVSVTIEIHLPISLYKTTNSPCHGALSFTLKCMTQKPM